MRSAFYFSVGVFLAFCLFWPGGAFAADTVVYEANYWCGHKKNLSDTVTNWTYGGATSKLMRRANDAPTNPGELYFYSGGYNIYIDSWYPFYASYGNVSVTACYNNHNSLGTPIPYTSSTPWEPPPSEPAHCSNNSLDPEETGVDCGGACTLRPCNTYCPEGYTLYSYGEGVTVYSCEKRTASDANMLCPSGFTLTTMTDGSKQCVDVKPTISADEASSISEQYKDDLNWYKLPEEYTQGTFNIMKSVSYSSTDNGNGTTTYTEVENVTNADGTTSTTTTSTTKDNSTGVTVSTSSSTTGTQSVEETQGNYDTAIPGIGALPGLELDTTIEAPEQKDLSSGLLHFFEGMPLVSMVQSLTVENTSLQCSFDIADWDLAKFGVPLTINLCPWESTLRGLGAVLVIVCQGYAILIIMGRK